MAREFLFHVDRFTGLDENADGDRVPGASPDLLNFKITPRGELVRRDGCGALFSAPGTLRGMWCGALGSASLYAAVFGETFYAAAGGFDVLSPVTGTVPGDGEVTLFPFMGKLYLLTGAGILVYDGTGLSPLEPYEPTLTTATAPNGDGTPLEDVNLLTPRVQQSFIPDGSSVHYHLATILVYGVDRIERGGVEIPDNTWYWDDVTGTVTFLRAPAVGREELVIHYTMGNFDHQRADQVLNCRYAMAFGGANDTRVFFYGCEDVPNVRFHSGMGGGLPNPAFIPVMNYTFIGDGSPITGILRHYDRQLIFTEKAAYTSSIAYETETDGRTRAIFPVLPLSDDRGNLPPGQPLLMENEPVTVTEAGAFHWVSTNVRDERNARLFSQSVRGLLGSVDPRAIRLFNRKTEGELFLVCGEDILVYRYGVGAFYRYRITDKRILFMAEYGEALYFGTASGIYAAGGGTDDGAPFPAYWVSPFLTLGARDREKNLFSAALCADTTRGGAYCDFHLITPEGEVPVQASAAFPEGSRAVIRRFSARHCHFERVQACVTERGSGRLHVRSLVLRGKVCDKHV